MAKYEVGWADYPDEPEWFDTDAQVVSACRKQGKAKYIRRLSDNSFVSPARFECRTEATQRRARRTRKSKGRRRSPLAGHFSSAFNIGRKGTGGNYCRICKGPHVYKHGRA